MKNWSLSLVLLLAIFLAPLFAEAANAQPETMQDTTLESGITTNSDNVTDNTTDNTTRAKSWWLRLRGVPGKGIITAPGLQKPFNPNWKGYKLWDKKLEPKVQQQESEQTQNNGEAQNLQIRERTRQQTMLQKESGEAQQIQKHKAAGEPKAKGKEKKNQP